MDDQNNVEAVAARHREKFRGNVAQILAEGAQDMQHLESTLAKMIGNGNSFSPEEREVADELFRKASYFSNRVATFAEQIGVSR